MLAESVGKQDSGGCSLEVSLRKKLASTVLPQVKHEKFSNKNRDSDLARNLEQIAAVLEITICLIGDSESRFEIILKRQINFAWKKQNAVVTIG